MTKRHWVCALASYSWSSTTRATDGLAWLLATVSAVPTARGLSVLGVLPSTVCRIVNVGTGFRAHVSAHLRVIEGV
jgi:hypothetical protein